MLGLFSAVIKKLRAFWGGGGLGSWWWEFVNFFKRPNTFMLPIFHKWRHIQKIIWQHFIVFTGIERCHARSTSKMEGSNSRLGCRCCEFFSIHQGTQRVPCNTETVADTPYMDLTIKNLDIASGLHEGVKEEHNFWWILILIAMKLPFLPSVRPIRKCRVGKIIRRGHSMPVPLTYSSIFCSYHEIKGQSWHHFS